MRFEIVLLCLFFLGCSAQALLGEPSYYQEDYCEERVCVYNYNTTLYQREDIQGQSVTTYATVEIACDSTGKFAYDNATKYCMVVTEAYIEHAGLNGTTSTPLDDLLSGWFCFIQLEDGRIPAVTYARNESLLAVNFKKGIVAGFQANFKGTEAVEETDPQSMHFSHYSYWQRPHGRSGWMHRRFSHHDVDRTATPLPEPVELSQEEDIHYEDGVLQHAHGDIHFWIPRRFVRVPRREQSQSEQDSLMDQDPRYANRPKRFVPPWWRGFQRRRRPIPTYNPFIRLNRFFLFSTYSLDLVSCSSDIEEVARRRREITSSLRNGYSSSPLTTVIDHEAEKKQRLQELHQSLPPTPQLLEYIHKHPQETNKVNQLKQLLLLEDKYGSPSESNSAVSDVLDYLQNIRDSSDPEDVSMRQKIYAMLSPLKSSAAHQALLSSLESVTDQTEWNGLLLNIALLTTPDEHFVEQLESLINAQHVNSLLLVYGALASRAEHVLQTQMVTFLSERLQEPTTNEADLIHLIQSLGNSGSDVMVDTLLNYISHASVAVQVATINAMRKKTNDDRVQAAFLAILNAPHPSVNIIGAIANTLIKGLEESGVGNKQKTFALANALVSSSKSLDNEYIEGLVSYYLEQLHQQDMTAGSRLRRDADNWMTAGNDYDMIASYEDRQEDGTKYPNYRAHLWSKQIGVRDLNLQVAAGMFTGVGVEAGEHKVFGKTVAKVNAFGESTTAMEVEVLRSQSADRDVHKIVYMTVGGFVLLNFEAFSDEEEAPMSYLQDTEYSILTFDWEVFVAVATVNVEISIYAQLFSYFETELIMELGQNGYVANGLLSPTLRIRAEGSSTFDVLGTHGGISLEGVIGYGFDAEASIADCTYERFDIAPVICTTISDQWPRAFVNLSSWYQASEIEPCGFRHCYSRGQKVPDSPLRYRWELDTRSPELLWGDCNKEDDYLECPPIGSNPTPSPTKEPPLTRPTWSTYDTEPITRPWVEKPTYEEPYEERPYEEPYAYEEPYEEPYEERPYEEEPYKEPYDGPEKPLPMDYPNKSQDKYDYMPEDYMYED